MRRLRYDRHVMESAAHHTGKRFGHDRPGIPFPGGCNVLALAGSEVSRSSNRQSCKFARSFSLNLSGTYNPTLPPPGPVSWQFHATTCRDPISSAAYGTLARNRSNRTSIGQSFLGKNAYLKGAYRVRAMPSRTRISSNFTGAFSTNIKGDRRCQAQSKMYREEYP
jgi:hypothetical protein